MSGLRGFDAVQSLSERPKGQRGGLTRLPERFDARDGSLAQCVERFLEYMRVLNRSERAVLELLYSSAIRRAELTRLRLPDLDREKAVLWVRLGKGSKDRVVPVGRAALGWCERYIDEVRPHLTGADETDAIFLTGYGGPFNDDVLGRRVRDYMVRAGIERDRLGCHLLRHTCATHTQADRGQPPGGQGSAPELVLSAASHPDPQAAVNTGRRGQALRA